MRHTGAQAEVYGCVFTGRRWLFELLASTTGDPTSSAHGGKQVSPAALIDALVAGVESLGAWYRQNSSSDFDSRAEFLPSPNSFLHNGAAVPLTYLRPYGSGRRSYIAVCDIAGKQCCVFVKFTRRYGQDAHRTLAAEGLAPELLYCGTPYPNYPAVDGVKMVVSIFDGAGTHVRTCQAAADAREKVQHAVNVLHRNGFVHGDLRWRNVLVTEDGSVSVLRFDWAGCTSEARYPL